MKTTAKFFSYGLIVLLILATLGWSVLAISYDAAVSGVPNNLLAAGYFVLCLAVFLKIRPFLLGVVAYSLLFGALLGWWFSIKPQMNRDWAPEYANLPHAEVNGNLVTFHNVRDFHYHSTDDYTVDWETRTYDLDKLAGLDMFFSYWGSPNIAHTIMSWDFEGGLPLPISIETRRTKGQEYSAVAGFFRQYELYYVVADERDPIGVRTNFRNEDVYLYRLSVPKDKARAALLDYIKSINALNKKAAWYNALTHNCTTSIREHALRISAGKPWNWRIMANGHLPELGYMRGMINTSEPFETIRKLSHINERALKNGLSPSFSNAIREGLPARPNGN